MNPTQGEKSATGETAQECHVMPPLKPVLSAMGQIMQSYDYVLLPFPQGPCSQKSVTEEAAEEDNSKSSPISECEPVSSSVQSVAQPNFKLNEPVTTPLNAKITVPADDCNDGDSETLSFEVLGKNSIDIQASSLASYVDIQQKSMEIDYISMIAPMSVDEIHKKLMQLLQENVKLKETLKQNNLAMKNQVQTLTKWYDEVLKVHKDHQKKFDKTREYINELKKENKVVKAQLAIKVDENMENKLKIKQMQQNPIESFCPFSIPVTGCIQTKKKCCSTKDEEITRLKESIAALVEKSYCTLISVELQGLSNSSSHPDRQTFIQNLEQYDDELQDLFKCFVAQRKRYAVVEKCLREITNVLELLDDDKLCLKFHTTESDLLQKKLSSYEEKLHNCHKELIHAQIEVITEKQVLVKLQNQFQKMFSDYNSALCELQITIEENAKLNTLKNNITRDNLRKQVELEETIISSNQLLEDEKTIFNLEKFDLEKEKKLLEKQKQDLDVLRESLNTERAFLQQEKITLNVEKTSLDHQGKLYDNQEKILQTHLKESQTEAQNWKQITMEKSEEIDLLRGQLTTIQRDFEHIKGLNESLKEEKYKVDEELKRQIEFNKDLMEHVEDLRTKKSETSGSRPTSSRQVPGNPNEASTLSPCPQCEMRFTDLETLTEHIERCLNLN